MSETPGVNVEDFLYINVVDDIICKPLSVRGDDDISRFIPLNETLFMLI